MTAFWMQALSYRLASIAAARHLLLCADYDGTLAPIAPRPEEARLLPGVFDLLNELAHLPYTRVAIISGRSLENLRSHSGFERPVLLVGSHGAELPDDVSDRYHPQGLDLLEAIESALLRICETAAGAWLERKPYGMAVHVRQVIVPDADRVLMQVRKELTRWPSVRVKEGKAVLELSLSNANKGEAVTRLRNDWGTDPQVLYLGDDVTDEDAFVALRPADLGVKVGLGPSIAKYRVASEHEALNILQFLFKNRSSLGGGFTEGQNIRGSGV